MRKYLLFLFILLFAIVMPSGFSTVEASPTYKITPKSNTYKGKFNNYTSLNSDTKHYYVLRSYLEHLEEIGGGTIELGRGTYTVTNTLYVPSNVTIKLNNGVTIVKGKETGKRVGSRAGEDNIKPSKSLFQFISPSKSSKDGVYGKYDGEKNISIIGSRNSTIDLDFKKDSLAIIAGHNQNVKIENITFKNMNSGHFIEIDATKDVIIRNNTFTDSIASAGSVKEAINIDTPDKSTLGWSSKWSKFDKTPNSNMLIEKNTFYDLDRAIGTHKYSGGMYHDQIIIRNNKIEKMRSDPIRVMNWSNSIIEDNLINDVRPSSGNNNRGILASGAIDLTIQNNVFANVPRAVQIFPWKNSGAGSQYDITYNELSDRNIDALKTNTIVNGVEDFIRINHAYGDYSSATTDRITIKTDRFYDLVEGDSGYGPVSELVDRNVINGYPDHSFKPHNNVLRQQVAVMLYHALDLEAPKNTGEILKHISDVSTRHDHADKIASVIENEIFRGNRNGNFNPYNNITRGQMASVLVKAFDLEGTDEPVQLIDLHKIDPSHRENVKIIAQNNVTIGKLNKNGERYYDANAPLSRVQFATLLNRSLEVSQEVKEERLFEDEVVKLTNIEREKQNLVPLKIDRILSRAARAKSRDMAAKNYFDHLSPTYGNLANMMELFGIKYRSVAENIAVDYSNPEAVVDAWMNSEGHRKNILNKDYTHIGVGYSVNGDYWTQLFIQKK